ncbi:MAG: hypothetical protein K1X57_17585 [Gemmataceae bacterium]|nr:hypothetical protein [Gemmataceae bacterium]
MKPLMPIAAALLTLLGSVGYLIYHQKSAGSHEITLVATGSPGSRFRVTLEIDGLTSSRVADAGEEIRVTGNRIDFAVARLAGPTGQFRVEVLVDGRNYGTVGGQRSVTGLFEFDGETRKVASVSGF